jgi:hypothetical protein
MVRAFDAGMVRLLLRIHRTAVAAGIDELARRTTRARSSFYRRQARNGLTFYPNIRYTALGLTPVHLFIPRAGAEWFSYPAAVECAWTVSAPGAPVLYLHCLIPTMHLAQELDAVRRRGQEILVIASDDAVQHLGDPPVDANGHITRGASLTPAAPKMSTVATGDPLLIPIALEVFGHRPNQEALWRSVQEHLGARVWQYLPRRRRLHRNGKYYVTSTFTNLNRAGIVQQHIIRYPPLSNVLIDVFVLLQRREELTALAPHAASIEEYPTSEGTLARILGNLDLIKAVLPLGARWWFVDQSRTSTASSVRFQHEALYDPIRGWQRPRHE